MLDEHRKAVYDFYAQGSADWQWTPDELAIPAGTQILHTGSLASWLPPGDEHLVAALRQARDTLLVSYDPNVRPTLLGTPERARPLIERAVAVAHLVKASDDDVGWLYPGSRLDAVAGRWLGLGAATVVLTRGERGAVGYDVASTRSNAPGGRSGSSTRSARATRSCPDCSALSPAPACTMRTRWPAPTWGRAGRGDPGRGPDV